MSDRYVEDLFEDEGVILESYIRFSKSRKIIKVLVLHIEMQKVEALYDGSYIICK